MIDAFGLWGELRFVERRGEPLADFVAGYGGEEVLRVANTISNLWYADVLNLLSGTGTPVLIVGALALGNGTVGTVARTDVVMANETVRYGLVTAAVNAIDPPSTRLSFFASAGDGPATWTEAGLFHGATATLTPGSGRMMSHLVFAYSKGASQDLRIDYTLARPPGM